MTHYHKFPKTSKIWGAEYLIVNTNQYCCKILEINFDAQSSLHFHNLKDEVFTVMAGGIRLEVGEQLLDLLPGESFRIKPGMLHRFRSLCRQSIVVESSTHDDPADSIRLESSRLLGEQT